MLKQSEHPWVGLTDEEVSQVIEMGLGVRDSIETALDRRFGKPTGTISDLIFQRDLSEPSRILEELKRDTKIYL